MSVTIRQHTHTHTLLYNILKEQSNIDEGSQWKCILYYVSLIVWGLRVRGGGRERYR